MRQQLLPFLTHFPEPYLPITVTVSGTADDGKDPLCSCRRPVRPAVSCRVPKYALFQSGTPACPLCHTAREQVSERRRLFSSSHKDLSRTSQGGRPTWALSHTCASRTAVPLCLSDRVSSGYSDGRYGQVGGTMSQRVGRRPCYNSHYSELGREFGSGSYSQLDPP